MAARPEWTTACPDWEERIIAGKSLVPCGPLFPAEAAEALAQFNALKLVDVPGQPTMGDACGPWIQEYVTAVFGSYNPETGERLIRDFFLLVSKKNIKSTMAAGIFVTMLHRNWRLQAELLILAPTIEIANNSFDPAFGMVRADEELSDLLHPIPHQRIIRHRDTHAELKVIAADSETVGGKKASFVFIDELWLFGKRANAQDMLREATGGLASRPEGFVMYASTQSDKAPAGVFAEKLKEFRDIRDGKVHDPQSLGVLYEFPTPMLKSKAYREPKNFYITNPNLGASVSEAYLVREFAKAERAGEAAIIGFAAKHLNVQIDIALRSDSWAGAEVWSLGASPGLSLQDVLNRSEVVTIGIDGGGLDDLLAIAVLGRETGTKRWLLWVHAFISPIAWGRRIANETEYEKFVAAKDLTKVDELPDDLTALVEIVKQVFESGLLAMVGVDKFGIGGIVDALGEIGITEEDELLTGVPQGVALMGPIKTFERKLADGSLQHGDQEIMSWAVGNAKVVPTATAIRIEREQSGYGKIDTLMAAFDAGALMERNPPARGRSYLDTATELALV